RDDEQRLVPPHDPGELSPPGLLLPMHPVAGVGPVAVVAPSGLWGAWTFDPIVVAGLGAAAALYAHGWAKLRGHRLVRPRQAVSFFAGLAVLAAALVSPVDALAGTLLSVHMAQHLILLVAAPPLLVYGRPGLVMFLGLPASSRSGLGGIGARRRFRVVGRVVLQPLVVLVASAAARCGWPLSGALMWIPPGAVEFLTIIFLALRWFEDVDRRVRKAESAVAGAPAGPARPFLRSTGSQSAGSSTGSSV